MTDLKLTESEDLYLELMYEQGHGQLPSFALWSNPHIWLI